MQILYHQLPISLPLMGLTYPNSGPPGLTIVDVQHACCQILGIRIRESYNSLLSIWLELGQNVVQELSLILYTSLRQVIARDLLLSLGGIES